MASRRPFSFLRETFKGSVIKLFSWVFSEVEVYARKTVRVWKSSVKMEIVFWVNKNMLRTSDLTVRAIFVIQDRMKRREYTVRTFY